MVVRRCLTMAQCCPNSGPTAANSWLGVSGTLEKCAKEKKWHLKAPVLLIWGPDFIMQRYDLKKIFAFFNSRCLCCASSAAGWMNEDTWKNISKDFVTSQHWQKSSAEFGVNINDSFSLLKSSYMQVNVIQS